MTKTELKYAVQNTGSHFFDRSTMRFFKDTMANYYVPKATVSVTRSSGETHTCYELQRRRPVQGGLQDSAYFDTTTFERILPKQQPSFRVHKYNNNLAKLRY